MLVGLYSPHGTYDAQFLANYAYINLHDPITRSPGIGNVQIFGAGQYAMRLWVKSDQLAKLGITVTDVINAIQAQNTVNPAGQVGGEPSSKDQEYTYAVRAQGRLASPEEFGRWLAANLPGGIHGVLRLNGVDHISNCDSQFCQLVGLHPQAHRILAGAEDLDIANTGRTCDGVMEIDVGIVGQKLSIVRAVRRIQAD